jgi:prophage regulatory protein
MMPTPVDMLEILKLDPGLRTFGELLQEREWAAQEISLLRARVAQFESAGRRADIPAKLGLRLMPVAELESGLMAHRFVRLPEVCKLLGLSKTTIYMEKSVGRFPAPVKIGNSVRWRIGDILAWQDALPIAVRPQTLRS